MKKSLRELCTAIAICFCATGNLFATDNQFNTGHTMDKNLNLTKEWDKVFPQSDKVSHSKVTFRNRYGITLAADMYKPKHADGKLPAIAISGPFGAVKEQSSGLYAQELAERGFLTIAFDPSYTGESGGEPWRTSQRYHCARSAERYRRGSAGGEARHRRRALPAGHLGVTPSAGDNILSPCRPGSASRAGQSAGGDLAAQSVGAGHSFSSVADAQRPGRL